MNGRAVGRETIVLHDHNRRYGPFGQSASAKLDMALVP